MAALLQNVLGDLPKLHAIGERAMEELYLSWQTCVAAAFDRYNAILDLKRSGKLPRRKAQATDLLVSLTSREMERLTKTRLFYGSLLDSIDSAAAGMMENIGAFREKRTEIWEDLTEKVASDLRRMRKE